MLFLFLFTSSCACFVEISLNAHLSVSSYFRLKVIIENFSSLFPIFSWICSWPDLCILNVCLLYNGFEFILDYYSCHIISFTQIFIQIINFKLKIQIQEELNSTESFMRWYCSFLIFVIYIYTFFFFFKNKLLCISGQVIHNNSQKWEKAFRKYKIFG